VNLDPANRFLLAPDLGMDKVMIYRLDLESGKLVANEPSHAPATPGAGPRHMAFSADGRFVYVINELGSTVSAFSYDADRGGLREVQSISTLPKGHSGDSTTADIHVHPNGEFLYGSNRGHDSIAIFRIDRTTGELSPLGHESTRGSTPRNFAIDPSGEFLLAANQNSDSIVTFRIDPRTGLLDATDQAATVPMPVCIKFLA
jgi:6-phosphogluconolactonase